MRVPFTLLFSLALVVRCTAQTPAEPQYEGSLFAAIYSGGYVLDWDGPFYKKATIYGRDLQPAYSAPFKGADGTYYDIWTIDSDGVAARAYVAHESGKLEGRIDLLDPSGHIMSTIKSGFYLPKHLAFAPDHSIWTVGVELGHDDDESDFQVIHHYARGGEELGRMLAWSVIVGDYNALNSLQAVVGGRWLYAAQDRVGFLSVLHRTYTSWIEVGIDGGFSKEYNLGDCGIICYHPVAMTAGGEVYAQIWKNFRVADGWAVLDRAKGTWRKAAGYPKGGIIGTDGDNLIFAEHVGPWTVLHSVSARDLRFEKPSQEAAGAAVKPRALDPDPKSNLLHPPSQ